LNWNETALRIFKIRISVTMMNPRIPKRKEAYSYAQYLTELYFTYTKPWNHTVVFMIVEKWTA